MTQYIMQMRCVVNREWVVEAESEEAARADPLSGLVGESGVDELVDYEITSVREDESTGGEKA